MYRTTLMSTQLAGCEWEYIDAVTRQSATFADGVRAAKRCWQTNMVEYPETDFGEALAIIARLVSGGLATKIYKVSLGNFDTHGNQAVTHTRLLKTLGDGIATFQADLEQLGLEDRVVGMTYSEFGRRVDDNGPGTDHGTAAPHFVFGANVDGGKLHGGLPDLSNLDRFGKPDPHRRVLLLLRLGHSPPLRHIGTEVGRNSSVRSLRESGLRSTLSHVERRGRERTHARPPRPGKHLTPIEGPIPSLLLKVRAGYR